MSYKINYTGGTNTDHIEDYKDEEYEINYTDLDGNNLTTLIENLSLMDIYNTCRASPQLCSKINWKKALKDKGFITEDTHFDGMNLLDTNNEGIIRNVNGNNFNGQITEDDWEKYKNVCQVALGSKNRDNIRLNIGKVKDEENTDEIIDKQIAAEDTNKKYCITFFKYLDSKLRRTNRDISRAVKEYFTSIDRRKAITKYGHIKMWNVSEVTNMMLLFKDTTEFLEDDDISEWDVSNVEIMSYMFANCENFNQDISKWNTSKVTEMKGMFKNTKFNKFINTKEITVNGKTYIAWDVSKVTDMSNMFLNATAFNQYIGAWDVSSVTNMSSMFEGAISFNRFIKTNKVTVYDKTYIAWDTSNVTKMDNMFKNAESFNQKIGNWNVSKVRTMEAMFYGAESFNRSINTKEVTINRETYIAWDVNSVEYMINMFLAAYSFNQDIGLWKINDNNLIDNMFTSAVSFNQNIDTKEVTIGEETYTAWDIQEDNNFKRYSGYGSKWDYEIPYQAFSNSGIEENAYKNAKAKASSSKNPKLEETIYFIESFPNWYRGSAEIHYDHVLNVAPKIWDSDSDSDSEISSKGYESEGYYQDYG